jgi:cytosine deaminase
MPLTRLIRHVRTEAGGDLVDIALDGPRIAAIGPNLPGEAPETDGRGGFAFPGFVETHVHLDKACILDRCPAGDCLADAIGGVKRAKAAFTEEDVAARAARVLRAAIGHGTTLMRTHVELDPVVGLRGLRGVQHAIDAHRWGIEVEICVFPQDGLLNLPGTENLLRQALAEGAPVLGACPYTDSDPLGHLDRIFALAREFDVPIDMHLDFDLVPDTTMIEAVCTRTEAAGWGGRVTIGHVTRLSALPPGELSAALRHMADAGVALTALPATDLFLMGREATHLVPRGVAPMLAARAAGVRCSLSTNNMLNPFTPMGDGSALRIAHLYAHVAQAGSVEQLATCFDMVAEEAAALMGRTGWRLTLGAPADLVVLAGTDAAVAVGQLSPALHGFKAGRPSFSRTPVTLHYPDET